MPPNIALQRTPLARPLGWARSCGVVACRRLCRFRCLPAAPLKASVGPPSTLKAFAGEQA